VVALSSLRPFAVAVALAAFACHPNPAAQPVAEGAPPLVIGDFDDDYGGRHAVSAREWIQQPRNRYHIVRWVPEEQYLIARNDSANRGAPGKWTRIDWVSLTGMPPYEWAFCLSAYDAPTQAAAEAATIARRDTPRTGCNGYPFSRMRRVEARR
jgi:hypothetical protein